MSSCYFIFTLPIKIGMHSKEGFLFSNVKTRQPTFLFSIKFEPLLRKCFGLVDSWILFLFTSLQPMTLKLELFFLERLVNVHAVASPNHNFNYFIITQVPPCDLMFSLTEEKCRHNLLIRLSSSSSFVISLLSLWVITIYEIQNQIP